MKNNTSGYGNKLRCVLTGNSFNKFSCCMGGGNSEADWIRGNNVDNWHWIEKELTYEKDNVIKTASFLNDGYLTMTADFKNDKIQLYYNGNFLGETSCKHNWLIGGGLTNPAIPFTIGLGISGNTYAEHYTKFDLYACRLYSDVLSSEQIKANYNATVAYHNILVNNGNAETGGNTGGTSF